MVYFSLAALAALPALALANWTQFRGPNGAGVGEGVNLPVKMSRTENLVWRTELPPGYSSPVVASGRVYVTAHDGLKLLTIAVDAGSGKELWRREVPKPLEKPHKGVNSPSAPTPATDGENVYVLFDRYGLIAYDKDGKERWNCELAPFRTPYGIGTSPVLADGKLLLLMDQDTDSYLLALDKDSGKTIWKTPRPEATHGFPAPVIYRPAGGPAQVLVSGSFQFGSYDLETGKKLWWVNGMAWQAKSMPVVTKLDGRDAIVVHSSMPAMHELGPMPPEKEFSEALAKYDADKDGQISEAEAPDGDMKKLFFLFDLNSDRFLDKREWDIFQARNDGKSGLFAIRPGGTGDVSAASVMWRYDKGLPNVPSPLVYQGVLYMLREGGILTAFDPANGEVLKQGRVTGALGAYFASPVAADGKLFVVSKEGRLAVIRPGADWDVLHVNALEEDTWATPAIDGNRIYVRTEQALYCFGVKIDG